MSKLFSLLMLSLLLTSSSCFDDDDQTTGIISGFVTDAFTDERIQGADISLSGKIAEQKQTGSNGEFRFTNLPAGEYDILVTAPNYDPDNRSVTLLAGDERNVDITMSSAGANTVGNDCFSVGNLNLNFGLTLNEMQVAIKNLKGIAQTLTCDIASHPWITLSPSATQTIQPGGTIVWTFKIDRTLLQQSTTAVLSVNTGTNSGGCTGFTLNVDVQI